jgi:DNA topoisomerase-1
MSDKPTTADSVLSAKAAGLRYVSDGGPGIRRKRVGKGMLYLAPDGKQIRAADELRRIRSLVIPPAWQEVWICPSPDGHIQATGRDARGRKQYRYHPRWREVRDDTKYDRMIAFAQALPAIRRKAARDLALPGLPRRKILAAVVRLLETTLIRVGNEEYARHNDSFGLTTMRDRHVEVIGDRLKFRFRGKSGKQHEVGLTDRRLAGIVKRSRDLPGYELFQYLDDQGHKGRIEAADVNAYLRKIGGREFTAKDFRTWAGTVLAARAFQEIATFTSKTQAKRNIVLAVESVAKRLGNTKAVCRKCYIHPAVIDAYLDGSLLETLAGRMEGEMRNKRRLPPEESAVLALLQGRLGREALGQSRESDAGRGKRVRSLQGLLTQSLKEVRRVAGRKSSARVSVRGGERRAARPRLAESG